MRKFVSIPGALVVLALTAGVVMGHHVNSISGTVDCDGNYSITVNGDVFDNVHLIVKLNGTTIFDAVTGQQGGGTNTYGPFEGTGAFAGETISAKPGDNNAVEGTLALTQESCDEVIVTPTPDPTPEPSLPNTASSSENSMLDNAVIFGYVLIGAAVLLVLIGLKRSITR